MYLQNTRQKCRSREINNLTNYSAFVELEKRCGRVKVSDLSWIKIQSASEGRVQRARGAVGPAE